MNTRVVRVLLVVCLLVVTTAAATAQLSVGVILGEPTGLSAKLWVSDGASVDLAVAWSFIGGGSIYIHGDYQQHFRYADVPSGKLYFFVGAGPKMYIGDDVQLGIRIPLGAVYEFEQAPLEVFIEAAPGLLLFPETNFDGSGGIGVRYRL
jgi:hypothetical protein